MRHAIVSEGQTYMIERWGGGTFYALHHKPTGKSVFLQGDDAIAFETQMELSEQQFPHWSADDIGMHLWLDCEYCLVATESVEA